MHPHKLGWRFGLDKEQTWQGGVEVCYHVARFSDIFINFSGNKCMNLGEQKSGSVYEWAQFDVDPNTNLVLADLNMFLIEGSVFFFSCFGVRNRDRNLPATTTNVHNGDSEGEAQTCHAQMWCPCRFSRGGLAGVHAADSDPRGGRDAGLGPAGGGLPADRRPEERGSSPHRRPRWAVHGRLHCTVQLCEYQEVLVYWPPEPYWQHYTQIFIDWAGRAVINPQHVDVYWLFTGWELEEKRQREVREVAVCGGDEWEGDKERISA